MKLNLTDKVAYQTTTYVHLGEGFVASYALDGNIETLSHTQLINAGAVQYWWVDMAQPYRVAYVLVKQRGSTKVRFVNVDFYLKISLPPPSAGPCDNITDASVWTIPPSTEVYNSTSCNGLGQYLTFRKTGTDAQSYLSIAELEIYVEIVPGE